MAKTIPIREVSTGYRTEQVCPFCFRGAVEAGHYYYVEDVAYPCENARAGVRLITRYIGRGSNSHSLFMDSDGDLWLLILGWDSYDGEPVARLTPTTWQEADMVFKNILGGLKLRAETADLALRRLRNQRKVEDETTT
jgi:hypothetical protein